MARNHPWKSLTQLSANVRTTSINLSIQLNMSQTPLAEEVDDERLLNAALATKFGDVKRTSAQIQKKRLK